MHDVKIDEAGISAAFDARAAGVPIAPGASAPPGAAGLLVEAPPVSDAWRPVTMLVASMLSNKVCPAWQVSQEVQTQWADALGECLDQLMPGGLANIDAWGPWGKLAFASGVWFLAGFDPSTMTLRPRFPPDPDSDEPPKPQQANLGGVFSTDA